jgi:protein SCO1/2
VTRRAVTLAAALVACVASGGAALVMRPSAEEAAPRLGRAAEIALIDQDGAPFRLSDLRGRVVVVSFMFTECYDYCPLVTTKLAEVQDDLGAAFARDVRFVSVTIDPETDDPATLRDFAEITGYNPEGWSFLTGDEAEVRAVARAYGVLMARDARNAISHNLLMTIVDRDGVRRMQYMGERFDTAALLADIRLVAGLAPPEG